MLWALEETPIYVAAIGGFFTVVGAYIAIVPQLKKFGQATRSEVAAGEQRIVEKVEKVEAHVTNGLNDAIIRLESMVADVRATQEVSITLDQRPMFRTSPHGALIWANEAAISLLGMSLPALQQDGWAKAVHPDDAETVFKAWKESVRTQKAYGPIFYRYIHPETKKITWVKAIAQPIINKRLNELEGWIATVIIIDGPKEESNELA